MKVLEAHLTTEGAFTAPWADTHSIILSISKHFTPIVSSVRRAVKGPGKKHTDRSNLGQTVGNECQKWILTCSELRT